MPTLTEYITETRRLLHDAVGNFWDDSELTDYINDARKRTVSDTGCLRSLQAFNLVAGTEAYSYTLLPQGSRTIDVMGINVIWGNLVYPLGFTAWSDLSAKLRVWPTFRQQPVLFSTYGQNTFYVGPIPDQAYPVEIDSVVLPIDLLTSLPGLEDQIIYPFSMPIAYYAAHKAKYKEQSYGESSKFLADYRLKALEAIASSSQRRIANAYGMRWAGS